MQEHAGFAGSASPNIVAWLCSDSGGNFTGSQASLPSPGSMPAPFGERSRSTAIPGQIQMRRLSGRAPVGMRQEQIEQLQRLELVHIISAGIAHDFKNVMQVIESYAALLQSQCSPGAWPHLIAQEILSATTRGTMLTNRWLAYSRHGELQKQTVDFKAFIAGCVDKIGHDLPKSIRVELRQCREEVLCDLDGCLMEQVLFNLGLNARDAMPQGGVLRVDIERVQFESGLDGEVPAGVYGKLSIADNGTGIAADDFERIFEPFFTTKFEAGGTGLGLPLVHSIVVEHHGVIDVRSAVGMGSMFTLYLPCR